MSTITVNLYYAGVDGAAQAFAREMTESGTVALIRQEPGNLRYEYFVKADDPETVLLIDQWASQEAIDAHHASPMMQAIADIVGALFTLLMFYTVLRPRLRQLYS